MTHVAQTILAWIVDNDSPLDIDKFPPDVRADWDAVCGFVPCVAALRLGLLVEVAEIAVLELVGLGLLREDGKGECECGCARFEASARSWERSTRAAPRAASSPLP